MKLKLKHPSQVVIEKTATNRAATPIENAMIQALAKIADRYKTRFFFPLDVLLIPEMLIEDSELNSVTRDTIRASVQEFYFLGSEYANNAYQLNMIVTERDSNNIKQISTNIHARFIANVVKWLNREKQIVQLEKAGLPMKDDHLDIEGAISRLAMVASTRGINHGTIDKLLQLKQSDKRTLTTQVAAQVYRGRPRKGDLKQIEERFQKSFTQQIEGPLVRWVTAQDDLVCPICLQFDDPEIVYDLATDEFPIPPDETHPNCRCRLLIVDPNIDWNELRNSYVYVG